VQGCGRSARGAGAGARMGFKASLINFLGVWTVPATISIHDLRLGILFWCLRICVIIYIVISLFMNGGYLSKEEPAGFPTFWFESGGLYQAQNGSMPPFCDNADFDYFMSQQDSYYWNQNDISCANMNYGDIVKKDVKSGFVTTIFKRLHVKKVECSSNSDPCAIVSGSPGARQESMQVGNSCTCAKQQDYFTTGAEKMTLAIEHAFVMSSLFYEKGGHTMEGSSAYKSSDDKHKKLVRTCVKKATLESDRCEEEFGPGEDIKYSIEKWLDLAGVNLDERLSTKVEVDVRSGVFPQRRSTGVKLHVYMDYEGLDTDKEVKCTITVKAIDGWNSIGSMLTYLTSSSQTVQEYYDDYKLGFSIEFFPTGVMGKFDFWKLLSFLVAGVVILGVVDVVVGIVAFKVLPQKDVYLNAQRSKLEYGRALAQFGITTALACHAFKQWDKKQEPGTEPELSRSELTSVFEGPFDRKTAAAFAATLTKEVGRDSLNCADLVELMSDGLVSVGRMKEHAEMSCGQTNRAWQDPEASTE